jgi:hypothetical protein
LYEIIPGKAYKLQFGNTNSSILKLKYFVPPGVFRFNGRFLMSLSDQPAQGIWRKRFPPTKSVSLVNSEISSSVSNSGGDWGDQVIINTMNNVEQFFYGEPRAGAMIISYGSSLPQATPLQSGDYVYSELNYQSGSNINFDVFWFVDKTCYDKWWSNPNVWDENNNPKEGYRHSCE